MERKRETSAPWREPMRELPKRRSGGVADRQKPPLGKDWLYEKLGHHPPIEVFGC